MRVPYREPPRHWSVESRPARRLPLPLGRHVEEVRAVPSRGLDHPGLLLASIRAHACINCYTFVYECVYPDTYTYIHERHDDTEVNHIDRAFQLLNIFGDIRSARSTYSSAA